MGNKNILSFQLRSKRIYRCVGMAVFYDVCFMGDSFICYCQLGICKEKNRMQLKQEASLKRGFYRT